VSQPAALRHQWPGDDLVYWDLCAGGLGDLGLGVPDLAETISTLVVMRFPHAVTGLTRRVIRLPHDPRADAITSSRGPVASRLESGPGIARELRLRGNRTTG
jgi:hypothetical protein